MTGDPSSDPTPGGADADSAKLLYSARMLYLSGGLFAIAGAIWLVSGNGPGIGLMFLGIAVALVAIGRTVSARA